MLRVHEKRRVFLATSAVALILVLSPSDVTLAQSGRKASRTAPAPVLTPSPEAVPQHRKFAELSYPVQLLIAKENTSKHLPSEDIIFNSFIQRLKELPNVEGTLIGDLKRDQAAKRALSETDAYVVLLQFDIDNFQGKKLVINSPDLEVKYFVYPPRTIQPHLKGKVYYQSIGGPQGRKADSPSDPPIRITVEAAGHEAAERLYFWLADLVGTKPERP